MRVSTENRRQTLSAAIEDVYPKSGDAYLCKLTYCFMQADLLLITSSLDW
jgi:hypothetical protein